MKIGIDARSILNPEKGDAIGVGHYTYQLIRHLLKNDSENEYVIFFDFRVREKDVKKFARPNVTIKFYPFSDYRKYLPGAYGEILGTAILQKEKLDVLHSMSATNRIPMGYTGKTIVTFHDMAMFNVPQCLSTVKRTRNKAVSRMMAHKADKIIAVSNSLQEDLQKFLNISNEKVSVIYPGLDERFFQIPEVDSAKIISKYDISKKYILFLGTLEPSKNISRLLDAFSRFKNQQKQKNGGRFDYQLVLAGKRGWLSQEYQQMIRDLGLVKDVIFTGYVIGDELVPLFRKAEFFVMPSLYEGFGMTVLEAFATETPAIISRVASLPELAGEAAHFVNPMDTAELAQALTLFAGDESLRGQYKSKGLAQAKKFNWDKAALETLEVYKSLK
ncbi:MAG: group 1 glycosyl transferase [uncultured bacterium]|nr:MAG: group 1 glycosyl transferase [uncultured bacterium]KKQ44203.1 MAG: mannosyltransferase B-like protein [Candidatus Moranbacteria bacterium GW2011_GWC2_37_8]KKQ61615.1 MAG: mannosyltransferase B-like protein [Parcubacteria group bacterium GW2011_GWC1_38_22]KKQ80891.1 MAG: mannosyltransferase B-like protein [Candidatus Moranbacteria bacterium GW2011_GWD2_38_7]